jgi:hypothetical protein
MDKGRHPHVVRTWTVERTKFPYRPPQPMKAGPVSCPDRFQPKKKIRLVATADSLEPSSRRGHGTATVPMAAAGCNAIRCWRNSLRLYRETAQPPG